MKGRKRVDISSPVLSRYLYAATVIVFILSARLWPLFSRSLSDDLLTQGNAYGTSTSPQVSKLISTSWLVELAQTFDQGGDAEIAIAIYRKIVGSVIPNHEVSETNRISLSYLCLYRISRCYLDLNKTQSAIDYANEAYQMLPRKEPFYHVARHFEMLGNDRDTALFYYGLAAQAPNVSDDLPFGERNIYALNFEEEILRPMAFPCTYLQELQRYQDSLDTASVDETTHQQTHDAMILIARPIFYAGYEEVFRKEGPFRPEDENNQFYYSTPTITRLHPDQADDFLIVCRLINYRVDPVTRQRKDFLPPGKEPRLTSALALHRGIGDDEGSLITISDDVLHKSASDVAGPEDPRIMQVHREEKGGKGDIMLIMTSWEYSDIAGYGARMASGKLHPDHALLEVHHAFPSPFDRKWEKNWAAFQVPGDQEIHFVYEWYPLTIGTFKEKPKNAIDFRTPIDTPNSFKYLRGSSNGVLFQKEIWFMVHGIGQIGYTYFHKIVVLDAQTMYLKRHSFPFTLEGLSTEFCLGMDIDEDKQIITIAYSVMDGSSVLRRIPLGRIEALMTSRQARV